MSETPTVPPDLLANPSDLAVRLDDRDADDPVLIDAIRRLSDRFRGATGNHITVVENDEIHLSGRGGSSLHLPAAPVTAIAIVVDGTTLVAGIDYQLGARSGIVRRDAGWPDGLDNIHITYSHGYASVPTDIQDAVLEMAEAFCNLTAGIESVTTGDETVKIANSLINGGSLGSWTDTVTKYTLGGNGDRS
jgi:hypothetical protein